MKKFFKIFRRTIFIIFTLFLLILLFAKIFESRIASFVVDEIGQQYGVQLLIESVDIEVLRHIPDATFQLNEVRLMHVDSSGLNQNDIELTMIERVYVLVDMFSLIKGDFVIKNVEVDGFQFDYFVSSSGKSNIDFLLKMFIDANDSIQKNSTQPNVIKSDSSDVSQSFTFFADDVNIRNLQCSYFDSIMGLGAKLFIPHITLNGMFQDSIYLGRATGSAVVADARYDEYGILISENSVLNFDIYIDEDSTIIHECRFLSNGIETSVEGHMFLSNPDSLGIDASVHIENVDFAILRKYIPDEYIETYGLKDLFGVLNIDTHIDGLYTDSLMPNINSTILFKDGSLTIQDYPPIENIEFKALISNGTECINQSTSLTLESFNISTALSHLSGHLKLTNLENPYFEVQAEMMSTIEEFSPFIPDSLMLPMEGLIYGHIETSGLLPEKFDSTIIDDFANRTSIELSLENYSVDLDSTLTIKDLSTTISYNEGIIRLEQLSLKVPEYNIGIDQALAKINLQSPLSQTDSVHVIVDSLLIESGESSVSVSGEVNYADLISYDLLAQLHINLSDFQHLAPDTLVKSMNGIAELKVKSEASFLLDSLERQLDHIVLDDSYFYISLDHISIAMTDSLLYVDNVCGTAELIGDSIQIEFLSAEHNGLKFGLNETSISNYYNTLVLNHAEQLYIETSVWADEFNYSDFEAYALAFSPQDSISETDGASKEDVLVDSISSNEQQYFLLVHGDAKINKIRYDAAEINDISMSYKLTDSVYKVDSLRLSTFEGTMNTSLYYGIKSDTSTLLYLRVEVDSMDIQQVLSDLNSIELEGLSADNISGSLTGTLFAKAVIKDDSLLINSTRASGDLKLENGGIYNYEPILEMSKFTGIKELDSIRFKTLSTQLFVMDGAAYVPKTTLVSNAFDAQALGMQNLNGDYAYHLRIHLGEILSGKSNKLLERQAATGDEISDSDTDRSAVYVVSKSTNGKTKNGFDKKKDRRSMELKIKVKNKLLDLVFHPYIVSFDTDLKEKDFITEENHE